MIKVADIEEVQNGFGHVGFRIAHVDIDGWVKMSDLQKRGGESSQP